MYGGAQAEELEYEAEEAVDEEIRQVREPDTGVNPSLINVSDAKLLCIICTSQGCHCCFTVLAILVFFSSCRCTPSLPQLYFATPVFLYPSGDS